MGSLFDEDDDEDFDLAAIEAKHAEMEAEALLEAEGLLEAGDELEAEGSLIVEESQVVVEGITDGEAQPTTAAETQEPQGIYPASDWEAIVEAVLFTMGNSVELRQLAIAIDQNEKVTKKVVEQLQERYKAENRGMQIIELESAYQMCTRAEYYENLIRVASAPKRHVLTDVVLETLSIIAYKQPVTKMEISKIRGVSSDHAVNRLVEYGLVCEVGRMDAPGRPALFATTEEFLRRFGVGSTGDLPGINPEQEEEIIQEVEEELQMKLSEYVGAGAGSESDIEGAVDTETDIDAEIVADTETEVEIEADTEIEIITEVDTDIETDETDEIEETEDAEYQD